MKIKMSGINGKKDGDELVLGSFVRKLEEQKAQVEKELNKIQENLSVIQRQDEKLTKIVREMVSADPDIEPIMLKDKLEMMQFIRERRNELDQMKAELSHYN
jgi:hypothetical protein